METEILEVKTQQEITNGEALKFLVGLHKKSQPKLTRANITIYTIEAALGLAEGVVDAERNQFYLSQTSPTSERSLALIAATTQGVTNFFNDFLSIQKQTDLSESDRRYVSLLIGGVKGAATFVVSSLLNRGAYAAGYGLNKAIKYFST